MAEQQQLGLVPGRTCGDCTVCCTVLPIRSPEFRKAPNTTCEHCIPGGGCGIYDTRPPMCRIYHCVWRQSPRLGEEWRPDKCGVLVTDEYDDIPEGYALRSGVRFILFGDHAVVRKPNFAFVIADLVKTRMPVFLSIPGPPGCHAAKIFLNRAMDEAARANNLPLVSSILEQGIAKLKTFDFPPAGPDD